MKTIHEMTDTEILALTGEDLERLTKIAYAHNGIKILDPPKQPDIKTIEGDLKFYEIGGFLFKEISDAENIAYIAKKGFTSEYFNYNYDIKLAKPVTEYNNRIDTVTLFSEQKAREVDKMVAENKRIKTEYEADRKEYDENYKAGESIRKEIIDKYLEVSGHYNTLNDYREKFKTYLDLADGNLETAEKFFNKAYPNMDQFEMAYIKDSTLKEIPRMLEQADGSIGVAKDAF